jgi:hypothetical protein
VIRDLVQQALVVLFYVGVVVITQEDQHLGLVHDVIDPRNMEIAVLDFHPEDVVGGLNLHQMVPKRDPDGPFIVRCFRVKQVIVSPGRSNRLVAGDNFFSVIDDLEKRF